MGHGSFFKCSGVYLQATPTPGNGNQFKLIFCESHLQYNPAMKTATIPPIRVAPEFRAEVEAVLQQGELLSEFVENAVRQTVLKRQHQAEFVRRGIAAIGDTKRAGGGIAAETVVAKLEAKLVAARRSRFSPK